MIRFICEVITEKKTYKFEKLYKSIEQVHRDAVTDYLEWFSETITDKALDEQMAENPDVSYLARMTYNSLEGMTTVMETFRVKVWKIPMRIYKFVERQDRWNF